ncbi:MAG: hypothetical protein AB1585_10350 [Thermodesulfobacteriota bacterium]
MSKVVSIESIKEKKAAKRGFREWQRLFKALPLLNERTRWSDLPDELILFLAEDDEGSRHLIQDLLLGVLDLGSGLEFQDLSPRDLNPLLDLYFLLIDQVRFECMRRLGWVAEVPLAQIPIIALIRKTKQGGYPPLMETPRLSLHHPGYSAYSSLTEMEKQAFIRRTIPEAVRRFQEKIYSHDHK